MTSRELTKLGRRFLKKLEADEWLRGTQFKSRKLEDLYGLSEWFVEERGALITVHNGLSYNDAGTTLVHEILHVVLEGHKPVTAHCKYDPNYELALNRIAKALWTEWSK